MLRLRAVLNARRALGLILIGGGLILFSIYASRSSAPLDPASLRYYGPLVPTPIGQMSSNATGAPAVSNKPATIGPASEPTSTADGSALGKSLYTTRQRICVGVPFPETAPGRLEQLNAGWYLDWIQSARPYQPAGIEYAQMVRAPGGQLLPGLKTIADIAHKTPGALWLIGNEMDVRWQDNATPEQYVTAYHDAYITLKQADPTSRIAIGGITQPSPLRLLYLERVLDAYRQRFGQDMPIDIWNIHNFLLPEKRGSWGVDIPPGISAISGMTYTIADHGNLELFKQQIVNFRRWMAERGYRDKELLVSEFGILMSTDYGYDYPRVRDFMLNTFEYLRTARDRELGLPADDNRLVQRWCWYSLVDTTYPTGNLADLSSEELTPLGRDFKAYLGSH